MSAVGYLFLRRYPLNWSQALYGYYVGFLLTIRGFNLLVLVPLLKGWVHVKDTTLFFLGILSFATSEFLFAFVRTTWQVFTGECNTLVYLKCYEYAILKGYNLSIRFELELGACILNPCFSWIHCIHCINIDTYINILDKYPPNAAIEHMPFTCFMWKNTL